MNNLIAKNNQTLTLNPLTLQKILNTFRPKTLMNNLTKNIKLLFNPKPKPRKQTLNTPRP